MTLQIENISYRSVYGFAYRIFDSFCHQKSTFLGLSNLKLFFQTKKSFLNLILTISETKLILILKNRPTRPTKLDNVKFFGLTLDRTLLSWNKHSEKVISKLNTGCMLSKECQSCVHMML